MRGKAILHNIDEPSLIGRDVEINYLNNYVEKVINGEFGGIIYIYGVAGVGKTKLITEIAHQYSNSANIITLYTSQKIQESFRPFIYFFNEYFNQHQDLSKDENKKRFEDLFCEFIELCKKTFGNNCHSSLLADLEGSKTFIGSLLGFHWEDSPYEQSEAQLRFIKIVKSIRQFFKAQSLISPLIIVIEDIHWLDEDSIETMAQLLTDDDITEYPMIILTTSRLTNVSDNRKPVIVQNYSKSHTILLSELDESGINFLIKNLLNHNHIDLKLLDFIRVRTGGNPYFIRQYCQYLIREKLITVVNDKVELVKGIDPYSLGSDVVVTAQLDKLSNEVKQLAYTASVLGMEFNLETIIEVTKVLNNFLKIADNSSGISQLLTIRTENVKVYLSKGKDDRVWKEFDDVKYSFDHPLLCEKLYNLIPKAEVKLLHLCVAEALEKIHPENPVHYVELAYHNELAERKDKAVKYLNRAIDYALSNYENIYAIKLYKRLSNLVTDPEEKLRISTETAILYQRTGNWKMSEETFIKNINKSKDMGNNKMLADNYLHYGCILWKKSDYNLSYDYLKIAEKLYNDLGDNTNIAYLNVNIGSLYYYQGKYDKALKVFKKQIKSGKNKKYDKNELISLINVATVYAQKCEYEKALENFTKALSICVEKKEKLHRITILINIGHIYVRTRQYEKAKIYITKSLEISKDIDFKEGIYSAYEMIGIVKYYLNELDSAFNLFKKVLIWAKESDDKELMASTYGGIGNIYKKKRDYDKALEYYDKSIEIGEKIKLKYLIAEYYHQKADLFYEKRELNIADELNNIAINIVKDMNQNDDLVFECLILEVKLMALNDKQSSIKKLTELQKHFTENYHKNKLREEFEKIKSME